MSDKPRLTLKDLIRNEPDECDHLNLDPSDIRSSFTIEDLEAAIKKLEEREVRPPIKVVHPAEKCHKCGRRAVDHSVEDANAHINSIAGWWE